MKRILVIDDDLDMLSLVEMALANQEFVVKTTWKWHFILRTIDAFSPDLILLDIRLSGADGGEICKKLKQSKETQHIPVILFSALNMSKEYIKACDAQGFLAKPFASTNLLEIIRHNLN